MKIYSILFLILVLSFNVHTQENNKLSKPPKVELPNPTQNEVAPIDITWADSIISKIAFIKIAQIRPKCDDDSLRPTIPTHSEDYNQGCYQESVLYSRNKINTNHIYNYQEIDTSDYQIIIQASFSKRRSNMVTMCYEPRHIILFYDSNHILLGVNEICFECGNAIMTFEDYEIHSIHDDDYTALNDVFGKYGFYKQ